MFGIRRSVVTDGFVRLPARPPERIDSRVRTYGSAAVVVGQTRMRGRYQDQPFSAHSRYTHVYVGGDSGWRLASAQGTPIAG